MMAKKTMVETKKKDKRDRPKSVPIVSVTALDRDRLRAMCTDNRDPIQLRIALALEDIADALFRSQRKR